MTAPASGNKYVLANFKNGIQNKKLWFILCVVNILSLPYGIFFLTFFSNDNNMSLIVMAFAMVVNVILGMVIPFLQFDYLYNKTKVDMAYSLPLSRKQKILSDFFAGLSMYVGGYLIQIVLTYVATAIYCTSHSQSLSNYWGYRLSDMGVGGIFAFVTGKLVTILLMQIMLYVLTTLVIACTGAMFEAVTAVVYTNILIPSSIYVVYGLCVEHLFGMDFSDRVYSIMKATSPLGGFAKLIFLWSSDESMLTWAIGYLITTMLFFVLATFILIRRKAEDVGKTFVIRPFYHVILVAVMLHIGVLACFTGNFIITFLLTTFTFYLIMEIITNRGFKKLKDSILRYGVIIATVLVVIIVISKTSCFGISYRVSDVSEVASIKVNYPGIFNQLGYWDVTIENEDNIETLLSIQKEIIEDYKEQKEETDGGIFDLSFDDDYDYSNSYVNTSISYEVNLKDGSSYSRTYLVSYQHLLELMNLELSDEYIDKEIDLLKSNTTMLYVSDIYEMNQKKIVDGASMGTSEVANEFFECLREDLKNTTVEEYLRPQETPKYQVGYNLGTITILDSYTNTMAFLEKYNVDLTLTEQDLKSIYDSNGIEIYKETANEGLTDTGYYSTACYRTFSETEESYTATSYSDELAQLLMVAKAQYISESTCYKIEINGSVFVIPEEYTELAEQVIAKNCEKEEYYQEYE